MQQPGQEHEDVVVLPAVPLDPVFAEAVDDALAGEQPPTSPHDPNRLLGSDPHDFAGLYIRHRSSFSLHARRFLRDPRDVDEVVQEAFLRLFLALPELDSELQALSYCRRTITNLCIDRYRADQRRPRLVDLESVPVDVLGDDEPDDPVIQAEDAAIVREALALLSPLHREALVKREIEEKPLPLIAAELGVPEDSVKHLLHRARRALRRRLAETHLAPGVDLDDVSTLSLLARSAVSGTGRVGVFVLLAVGLVLGTTTTRTPVVEAFDTISGLWQDRAEPPRSAETVAVPSGPELEPLPPRSDSAYGLDDPGPIVAAPEPAVPVAPGPAAPVPAPVDGPAPATGSVTTSPSPSPSTSAPAPPSPTSSPRPEVTAVPSIPVTDPRPERSEDATDAPADQPSAAPSRPVEDEQSAPRQSAASAGQPGPAEGGPVLLPSRRDATR